MDREKVIKGLELCTDISQDGCMMLCPYRDEQDETYSGFCEQVLKRDALELLKEREAVVPRNTYSTTPSGKVIPHIFCGKCDKEIYAIYEFCPFCGQAVKWE